jgi:hypothetical protein
MHVFVPQISLQHHCVRLSIAGFAALEYPGQLSAPIVTTLAVAIQPLIRYLSVVRLSDFFRDSLALTKTEASSHVLTPPQLIDCALLSACLWLEAYVLQSASSCPSASAVAKLRGRIDHLLDSENHLDTQEALLQLRSFYSSDRLAQCELGEYSQTLSSTLAFLTLTVTLQLCMRESASTPKR